MKLLLVDSFDVEFERLDVLIYCFVAGLVGGFVCWIIGLIISYFIKKKKVKDLKVELKKDSTPTVDVKLSYNNYIDLINDYINIIDKINRSQGYDLNWAVRMVYEMCNINFEETKNEIDLQLPENEHINDSSECLEILLWNTNDFKAIKQKLYGEPNTQNEIGHECYKYDRFGILISQDISSAGYLLLFLAAKLAEKDIQKEYGEKISRVY